MPRKLTDAEINAQKEFMYERTVKLISKKGVSSITLDDILDTLQMAKGTFYRYYSSKEIFLYEVIKKNERILFEKLIKIVPKMKREKESMFEEMNAMIVELDSLFASLVPEDVEKLLRKMPSDYRKQEEEKSINNFVTFCSVMNINPTEEFFGALSYLMLALQAIATCTRNFSESGKNGQILLYFRQYMVCLMRRWKKMKNRKNEIFNRKLFMDHLLITLIIMGICWGACILLGINEITKDKYIWINIPYIFGAFSTTIASYIALKKNNEVTGFKEWLKNVFDFRHSVWSYVLVIALTCLQALLMCLIGGFEKVAPVYVIILMLPIMLIGGGLEEAGWRYITFPELDKKFGFTLASLITGIIWAFWHLPLFYIPGVNQYGKNFVGFTIMAIGLSFVLGAIRKVTGSVWLCVLGHMIVNSIMESYRYDFYGNTFASSVTTVVLIVVSIILVYINKKIKTNMSHL